MSDARTPRHEARDGDDSSSNWRNLYAELNADPNRQRRRRRVADDDQDQSMEPATDAGDVTSADDSAKTSEPAEALAPSEELEPDETRDVPGPGDAPRRGRHSAPDDDENSDNADAPVDETYRPRRWRPDTGEQPVPVDATGPVSPASDPNAPARAATGSSSTTPDADQRIDDPGRSESDVDQEPGAPALSTSGTEQTELADDLSAPGAIENPSADQTDESGQSDGRTSESTTPWPPHLTGPEFGEPEPGDVHHQDSSAPIAPARPLASGGDPPAAGDDYQSRGGSRHAAASSGLPRLPIWLWSVIGVVILALLAWLIIGLATGGDDEAGAPSSTGATEETSASPTSMNLAEVQPILCTGQSYAFINTGLSADEMLADPGALRAQYPDAQLATVPGGCIEGSTTADEVVLALGPYNSLDETCAAVREIPGAQSTVYTGSANTGLTEATCP